MSDYDPKDVESAIKVLWALVVIVGFAFITLVVKSSHNPTFL